MAADGPLVTPEAADWPTDRRSKNLLSIGRRTAVFKSGKSLGSQSQAEKVMACLLLFGDDATGPCHGPFAPMPERQS
jgi:hypothetical protein